IRLILVLTLSAVVLTLIRVLGEPQGRGAGAGLRGQLDPGKRRDSHYQQQGEPCRNRDRQVFHRKCSTYVHGWTAPMRKSTFPTEVKILAAKRATGGRGGRAPGKVRGRLGHAQFLGERGEVGGDDGERGQLEGLDLHLAAQGDDLRRHRDLRHHRGDRQRIAFHLHLVERRFDGTRVFVVADDQVTGTRVVPRDHVDPPAQKEARRGIYDEGYFAPADDDFRLPRRIQVA